MAVKIISGDGQSLEDEVNELEKRGYKAISIGTNAYGSYVLLRKED